MNWIDLKVRKPTAGDADKNGEVLWLLDDEGAVSWRWSDTRDAVAWMPIPEFTPIPDPPEGYEILTDYDAEPDLKALCWLERNQDWYLRPFRQDPYTRDHIYAVPIKPPEPQYRPFANADEFRPFRERWWRFKNEQALIPPQRYCDKWHSQTTWMQRFEKCEFEDGTPFGMPVN